MNTIHSMMIINFLFKYIILKCIKLYRCTNEFTLPSNKTELKPFIYPVFFCNVLLKKKTHSLICHNTMNDLWSFFSNMLKTSVNYFEIHNNMQYNSCIITFLYEKATQQSKPLWYNDTLKIRLFFLKENWNYTRISLQLLDYSSHVWIIFK